MHSLPSGPEHPAQRIGPVSPVRLPWILLALLIAGSLVIAGPMDHSSPALTGRSGNSADPGVVLEEPGIFGDGNRAPGFEADRVAAAAHALPSSRLRAERTIILPAARTAAAAPAPAIAIAIAATGLEPAVPSRGRLYLPQGPPRS